jgi:putative ATP-grasp target RiPP
MFPLGATAGRDSVSGGDVIGNRVPFGLRYLAEPDGGAACEVDWDAVLFDESAQISMMPDGAGVVPLFKHTSGQTSTTTNAQDRQSSDSDSDVEHDK